MKEDKKERSDWKEEARRQEREEQEEDETKKKREETAKTRAWERAKDIQEQITGFRPSKPPPPLPNRRRSPEKTTRKGGRAIKGFQETSIENGETIQSDWETWSEREGRIKAECEKNDESFGPGNDWNIAERQAADYARALENAGKKTNFAIPITSLQTQPWKIKRKLLGSKWQNRMVSGQSKRKRTAGAKRQRILPSLERRKGEERGKRKREKGRKKKRKDPTGGAEAAKKEKQKRENNK